MEIILQYIEVIIGIAVAVLCIVFRNAISKGILVLLSKILFSKKPERKDGFVNSLKRPFSLFIVVLGIFIGVYINYQKSVVLDAFKIATILLIAWGIISYVTDNLMLYFDEDKQGKLNGVAIKLIGNILKVVVVCLAVVMVVSELGYNINGLITGLGVGGLAVSLAAQDSLENLITGFFIMIDRPFDVGDLIETSSYKGIVEDITMRSTRIRKLDDTVVIVPNSIIGNEALTNISKQSKRLVEFKIGLLYSTSLEVIKKCESDIYTYLENNENVVNNDDIRVRFTEFDDSSLNIEIRCYIVQCDYEFYCKFLEELNLEIKKIVEENGAEFAFPTTSVHIEKD